LLSVGIASWATGADLLASGYAERCISPMTGDVADSTPRSGPSMGLYSAHGEPRSRLLGE